MNWMTLARHYGCPVRYDRCLNELEGGICRCKEEADTWTPRWWHWCALGGVVIVAYYVTLMVTWSHRRHKVKIEFLDSGRIAKHPADPQYPDGMDVDVAGPLRACTTSLPYPSPRCGFLQVQCEVCQFSVILTVAGRRDDPRSLRIPCKVSR